MASFGHGRALLIRAETGSWPPLGRGPAAKRDFRHDSGPIYMQVKLAESWEDFGNDRQ